MEKALADMERQSIPVSSSSAIGSAYTRQWPGPAAMTSEELAKKTGTPRALCREWLSARRPGLRHFDAESGKFTLPDEQALALRWRPVPHYSGLTRSCLDGADEPESSRGIQNRRRSGRHEHNCKFVRGHRALFSPKLFRAPGERVDSRARCVEAKNSRRDANSG